MPANWHNAGAAGAAAGGAAAAAGGELDIPDVLGWEANTEGKLKAR